MTLRGSSLIVGRPICPPECAAGSQSSLWQLAPSREEEHHATLLSELKQRIAGGGTPENFAQSERNFAVIDGFADAGRREGSRAKIGLRTSAMRPTILSRVPSGKHDD
jgi:hypothetical protein